MCCPGWLAPGKVAAVHVAYQLSVGPLEQPLVFHGISARLLQLLIRQPRAEHGQEEGSPTETA